MNQLEQLDLLVEELNLSSSTLDKQATLEKYPQCKELLAATYDSFTNFYVTSSQLKKNKHLVEKIIDTRDIFDLLQVLSSRTLTGHDAIKQCNWFISENIKHRDLIYNILDRDLKCRVKTATLNKVWKGLISVYDVALAKDFEDYKDKIDFEKNEYLASRKLDGIRIEAFVKDDTVIYKSRRGKEKDQLDKLTPWILKYFDTGDVLDCEACIIDKYGAEDFNAAQGELNRKNHTIENPALKVFDLLTQEEFSARKSKRKFTERLTVLWKKLKVAPPECPITMVEQTRVNSHEEVKRLSKKATAKGWEGLILRKNAPYKGKRSWDLLKVKDFIEAEYKVEDLVFENIRYIEDGKELASVMLSAVTILHKGQEVSVGSGFSMDQRKHYYANPEELRGAIITVKYFEETSNKEGTISLRFPTVKAIHGERREL